MRFRELLREDEASLWKALYHAIHVPPGQTAPPPEIVQQPELARYVAGWKEPPDDLGMAAEELGDIVGAAWLRRWAGDVQGYGFVDEETPELSMAVWPGHRGRGVGTRLLRELLDRASRRFDAVSLSVSLTNPARRLYERVGFEKIAPGPGDSVTMIRHFDDSALR